MAFPPNFYPGNYLWWKQPTYNYNPENAAAVPAPAPQPVQPASAIAPQPLPTTMQKLHSPVRLSSKTTTPPLSYPPPPPPPPPPKDKVISLDFILQPGKSKRICLKLIPFVHLQNSTKVSSVLQGFINAQNLI